MTLDLASVREDLRRLGVIMLAAGFIGYFLEKPMDLEAIIVGLSGLVLWLFGVIRLRQPTREIS